MASINQEYSNPTLKDVLDTFEMKLFYKFNCHRIGVIQHFNVINQSATIQMIDKMVIMNENQSAPLLKDFPILIDCPVVINANAIGGITTPINVGDTCLILFNDRDMDNWIIDGNVQAPNTSRSHDFSDAIALPYIFNNINALTNYNNNATSIYYGDTKVVLTDKIQIQNAAQNLKIILDNLISSLTNLEVVDPISGLLPVSPGSISALNAVKAQIDSLFY
jgi:hypothetical protein